MQTKIIHLHCSPDDENPAIPSVDEAGGVTFQCMHVQNGTEVVLIVGGSLTEYSAQLVEVAWTPQTRFKVFDFQKRTAQKFTIDGKAFEVSVATWGREGNGWRFDFGVHYEI